MRVLHLVLDGESCGVRGVAHGQEQLDTSRKRLDEGGDSLDDLLKLGLKDLGLLQEVRNGIDDFLRRQRYLGDLEIIGQRVNTIIDIAEQCVCIRGITRHGGNSRYGSVSCGGRKSGWSHQGTGNQWGGDQFDPHEVLLVRATCPRPRTTSRSQTRPSAENGKAGISPKKLPACIPRNLAG